MSVPSPWPLLEKRFPSKEYALLQEVRDKAGFYASRSADGIAMPSADLSFSDHGGNILIRTVLR